MKRLDIGMQKGDVGKSTTTTIDLAGALAARGRDVLSEMGRLDLDSLDEIVLERTEYDHALIDSPPNLGPLGRRGAQRSGQRRRLDRDAVVVPGPVRRGKRVRDPRLSRREAREAVRLRHTNRRPRQEGAVT